MRNFQDTKNYKKSNGDFRKVVESWPALIVFGILLFIFTWNVFSFLGKMVETGRNKKIVENKVAELERSRVELESNIASISTDKGVEERIREKYGLGKEGEGMVQIVEDKKAKEADLEANSGGFFSFFTKWFK